MAARLINRLNSDTCVNCSHSAAQFGPYLDTGIVIPGATKLVPVVYCAGCATQIMQPLDVVPRTALRTARDEVRREQEFSADVSQQL